MIRAPYSTVGSFAFALAIFAVFVSSSISFGDGLPGEFLVTQRWRELFGTSSPVANPAYIGDQDYVGVRAAFAPSLQGAYKLWELGAVIPVGISNSFGFTWMGQDDGTVQASAWDASGRLVPLDSMLSNQSNLFMLSYSFNRFRKLNIGGNINFAYQTNFGEPLKGIGLDIGAAYRLFDRPEDIGRHLIGISSQNVVAPAMSADKIISFNSSSQYARNLKCSWSGLFLADQLEGGFDLDFKDILAAKDEFSNTAISGSSISLPAKIEWDLSTRIGARLLKVLNVFVQIGFDSSIIDYWGVAGGMNVPSLNEGRDLQFLYQYNQKAANPGASTHTIYLKVGFGKHRQETLNKRLTYSPNELFNKARNFYFKHNYWDALFVFGQLEKTYPDFFKADWVAYYMGSCFDKLDLRDMAIWHLNRARTRFPESTVLQFADLDLVNIYYHRDDLPSAIRHFGLFTSEVTSDSMKFHGCYTMGQEYLKQRDYVRAIQLLGAIPQSHQDFSFAMYSTAVAFFNRGDTANAEKKLLQGIQKNPTTPAEKEMFARTCLMLGYLYYDQKNFENAVAYLRLVPQNSKYFPDALLGLGWSNMSAHRWTDCVSIGQTLQQIAGDFVTLKAEGVIIEGSGYVGLKRYDDANTTLKPILEKIKVAQQPSVDSLDAHRALDTELRNRYEALGDIVNDHTGDLAEREKIFSPLAGKISSRTLLDSVRQLADVSMHTTDSLKKVQTEIKISLDQNIIFFDDFARQIFLCRNLVTIRNDLEYILTRVQQLNMSKKSSEILDDSMEKQKKVEQEIKNLKNQIEQTSDSTSLGQ